MSTRTQVRWLYGQAFTLEAVPCPTCAGHGELYEFPVHPNPPKHQVTTCYTCDGYGTIEPEESDNDF